MDPFIYSKSWKIVALGSFILGRRGVERSPTALALQDKCYLFHIYVLLSSYTVLQQNPTELIYHYLFKVTLLSSSITKTGLQLTREIQVKKKENTYPRKYIFTSLFFGHLELNLGLWQAPSHSSLGFSGQITICLLRSSQLIHIV